MSVSIVLLLLAAALFGIAAFTTTPRSGRCVAGGLFCMTLSQLIGSGVLGLS